MAKRIKKKSSSGPKGGGGNAGMLAQLQQMQDDMVKAQAELENETVDVTVGGGAIKIVMTGHQRIKSIEIDKDLIDLEDDDWLDDLQELLMLAFNQAVEQSQSLSAERMEGITGGLPPGLDGMLGL